MLAPITRRKSTDNERNTETGEHVDVDRSPIGFRAVPVWDVSQTEGEELPQATSRLLGNDPSNAYARLTEVAHAIGYTVEDADDLGGPNGDCSYQARRIRILTSNAPAQRAKTLAHEIAHSLLHDGFTDRVRAELEAESVAYVVCMELDLDSGTYSFGYVSAWAGGGDEAIAGIKASGARIQKAAHTILDLLAEPEADSTQADRAVA